MLQNRLLLPCKWLLCLDFRIHIQPMFIQKIEHQDHLRFYSTFATILVQTATCLCTNVTSGRYCNIIRFKPLWEIKSFCLFSSLNNIIFMNSIKTLQNLKCVSVLEFLTLKFAFKTLIFPQKINSPMFWIFLSRIPSRICEETSKLLMVKRWIT